jgi:hypothetical protein
MLRELILLVSIIGLLIAIVMDYRKKNRIVQYINHRLLSLEKERYRDTKHNQIGNGNNQGNISNLSNLNLNLNNSLDESRVKYLSNTDTLQDISENIKNIGKVFCGMANLFYEEFAPRMVKEKEKEKLCTRRSYSSDVNLDNSFTYKYKKRETKEDSKPIFSNFEQERKISTYNTNLNNFNIGISHGQTYQSKYPVNFSNNTQTNQIPQNTYTYNTTSMHYFKFTLLYR